MPTLPVVRGREVLLRHLLRLVLVQRAVVHVHDEAVVRRVPKIKKYEPIVAKFISPITCFYLGSTSSSLFVGVGLPLAAHGWSMTSTGALMVLGWPAEDAEEPDDEAESSSELPDE